MEINLINAWENLQQRQWIDEVSHDSEKRPCWKVIDARDGGLTYGKSGDGVLVT